MGYLAASATNSSNPSHSDYLAIGALVISITSLVLAFLAYQLSVKTYNRDTAKMQRDEAAAEQNTEPVFVWGGGMCNYANAIARYDVERDFANRGAPVRNLSIVAEGASNAKIFPSVYIGRDQGGRIEVSFLGKTAFAAFGFTIHYETERGKKKSQVFKWDNMNDYPQKKTS